MNRMLIVWLLALISCTPSPPGYTKVGDDLYLSLHRFGDEGLELCDAYYVDLTCKLWRVREKREDYHVDYGFQQVDPEIFGDPELSVQVCGLHAGDSVSYILPYGKLKGALIDEYESDGYMPQDTALIRLDIAVLRLWDEATYMQSREEALREGIVEENTFLRENLEQRGLIALCQQVGDTYYMKTRETQGEEIRSGMEIALDYQGYFLDGEEFDDSQKGESTMFFQVGKPDQVVPAIVTGTQHGVSALQRLSGRG